MKFNTTLIVSYTLLVLCTIGCSDSFLDNGEAITVEENTQQLDIAGMKTALTAFNFKEGINDFEYDILNNEKWSFRLIAPEITDNELVPLFVDLHGGALQQNPNMHKSENCILDTALEDTKAYVLRPNSQGYLWFDRFNELQVVNFVEFAIENLNVDPNRVVVYGYSDGGFGSWFFADTHPELFSAAIPVAQAYSLITNTDGLKKTEKPLYVIHGEFDDLFPFTNTESLVEQSVNVGSDIIFVKATGLTHHSVCDYTPYVIDAIDWLKTTVWQ